MTATPSVHQNKTPAVEPSALLAVQSGMQALLDTVPVALLGFQLQGAELRLVSANAAARQLKGLRMVRSPGTAADKVFVLLSATHLAEDLLAVVRTGEPLDCRHVLRERGRLVLAWKIHAQCTGIGSVLVTVQDMSEAEILRARLEHAQALLEDAQREQREQTQVYGAMEGLARTGYWRRIWDAGETVLLWSAGLCDIAGFEQQEWISSERALSGILPEDLPAFLAANKARDGRDFEYRWRRPDGQVRWMRSRVSGRTSVDGVLMEMGVVQDVTEEYRAAERLREQLDFIQRIASNVPGFIYQGRLRPGGKLSLPYVSDAVQDMMGVPGAHARHSIRTLRGSVLAQDRPMLLRSLQRALRNREAWQCEYRVVDAEGQVRWHMTSATLQEEGDGTILLHGYALDITDRKQAAQEIERLAFYDPLTRLPNRRLLLDRLQRQVLSGQRTQQHGALLFIDLDNFKDLNDTLGHDMGDQLLAQVAARLSASVRECDTVARFGGDEFVVLLEGLDASEEQAARQAEIVARKLLMALNQPFELAGREHYSTPSIGLTLFGPERQSVDELLKRADLAMYEAKAAGRNTHRFFDPGMQQALHQRSSLEAELRQGLARGELFVHYQSVVDSQGHVKSAEALARWRHPERGLISPAEFIPLAEQTGLILPLGRQVLQTACSQLVRWSSQPETAHLSVAVNVSARQFKQSGFVAEVLHILRETGANPRRLRLELTESLLLGDIEDTIERMGQLKREGVGFALDDFGTGYSSLGYLKRLPLDQVKIDRGFVRDVLSDPNDAAIVRTILALAQSLDLDVVAEGVETAGQLGFLRLHGCEQFQGYLFGRPGTVEDIEAQWAECL
ncbi:MAG: EAL domain-containing protein [Burkholderiales bacterium]|nr:EAL domain-containing protein [Burkholderiales bacterium]